MAEVKLSLAALLCMSAAAVSASSGSDYFRVVRASRSPEQWCLLDSAGEEFNILAIEKANMRGPYCEKTKSHPYEEFLSSNGVSRAEWARRTARRLKKWGFNTLGTSADDWLRRYGFARTEMVAFSGNFFSKRKDAEFWITPWRGAPCQAFPNVFHPEFEKQCDEIGERACEKLRNDHALVGYYLDNELNWWGEGDWHMCFMLDKVLRSLPENHLAYRAAVKVLDMTARVPPKEYLQLPEADRLPARRVFTEQVARRYFRITTDAIRRHDPNHLILGCRFAGIQGAPDEVWRIAGEYCDVVSFNCYPTADVGKGTLTASIHSRTIGKDDGKFTPVDLGKLFDERFACCQRPLFVTEWSFIGLDTGLPCKVGCGQRLKTQSDRAKAVGMFLDFAKGKPYLVGTEFFMWVDEPALGCTKAHPEDSNYGLVNVRDEPYRKVTAAFESRADSKKRGQIDCPDGNGWVGVVRTNGVFKFDRANCRPWKARAVEKVAMTAAVKIPRENWAKDTAETLRKCAFNAIGSGSDPLVSDSGRFYTTEMLAISMWMRDRGEEYRLYRGNRGFCDELPNVFHPEFKAVCEMAAKASCEKRKESERLIGYFLDNELNWWGDGDWRTCGLLDYALKNLPADHAARQAAEAALRENGGDLELARARYTEQIAERYFATAVGAVRRHDPNHLIMGVRFAGIYGAPDMVWRIAGKWCDVITLNCYPRYDERDDALFLPVQDGKGGFARRPLREMLSERFRICGRPLFVSEWSFMGADVENSLEVGVAQMFPSQHERAKAVTAFNRFAASTPFVIGDAFYRWSDEHTTVDGKVRTMNWGLVDASGNSHHPVATAMSERSGRQREKQR